MTICIALLCHKTYSSGGVVCLPSLCQQNFIQMSAFFLKSGWLYLFTNLFFTALSMRSLYHTCYSLWYGSNRIAVQLFILHSCDTSFG